MSSSAQVTITPTVLDRPEIAETFVNGPMSIQGLGATLTIIFTVVRPNFAQAVQGHVRDYVAPVATRVTMPVETAIELKKLLNQTLPDQPNIVAMPSLRQ
jgi:hypothetical protein